MCSWFIIVGSTPVRKEHHYPRQLAATSPHERIIQRFRAAMNEVVADNQTIDQVLFY